MSFEEFSQLFHTAHAEISKVVVGNSALIEQVLVALLAKGHVLIEGVPGLGKTLLARSLGKVLGVQFKRIQFTPDLMPTDVTGGNVYDTRKGAFVFNPGPIFAELVLADEVNRAPAKTQSALLEAMQENTVTADGESRPLPQPFFIIATQNPIESQGTYPLPEAQLDRFLMKLLVAHPGADEERKIVAHFVAGFDAAELQFAGLRSVLTGEQVRAMQARVKDVRVAPEIINYVVEIVGKTRLHPSIQLGASPRGALGLTGAARCRAASLGRDYVIPDDVKALAAPVLRHRLLLQPDAELENVTADECVETILRETKVPANFG